MAKYLVLWQLDTTRVPATPQEARAMWEASLAMVEEDLKAGSVSKDWGQFVGEMRGYAIAEGTEMDVATMLQKFMPYVQFEVHSIMSARMLKQVIKTMPK